MWREECDVFVVDESLIKEFTELDAVVQLTDSVIFSALIILKDNDVLYLLMPDRKVDSRLPTSDAVLCAASDS